MFLAHISDLHFDKDIPAAEENLHKILHTINTLDENVDAVLISGDLTQQKNLKIMKAALIF